MSKKDDSSDSSELNSDEKISLFVKRYNKFLKRKLMMPPNK